MRKLAFLAVALAATGLSTTAQATIVNLGYFPHQGAECNGGSFSSCFASQAGVNVTGSNESSVIYKFGPDGTDFGPYNSITGSEFSVTYTDNQTTHNQLTFTYTPNDANDPAIHYFAIFQGGDPVGGAKNSGPGYELFYDGSPAGITTDTLNLSTYFQNSGYSHITFFDGSRVPGLPEPGTWAMMLLGFGAVGFGMRRSRKALLTQIA